MKLLILLGVLIEAQEIYCVDAENTRTSLMCPKPILNTTLNIDWHITSAYDILFLLQMDAEVASPFFIMEGLSLFWNMSGDNPSIDSAYLADNRL